MNIFLKKHQQLAKSSNLTLEELKIKIKFNEKDIGWIIISIGMAIGRGIIFLPIQIGLMGFKVFLLSSLIGYPSMYLFQRLFINTLSSANNKNNNNYTSIISSYLGNNIGIICGIIYFLLLLADMFSYSITIVNDSASYLYTFGITKHLLSDTSWYWIIIIGILMLISSLAEKLLFRISGLLVITKLLIITILAVAMLSFIDFANIGETTNLLIEKSIITLPFTLTSILFIQTLSPMVISFRNSETNIEIAKYKALRAMNIAFVILFIIVFFYIVSFSLSINYNMALSAYNQNISSLAIAAQFLHVKWVIFVGIILNIFAISTSFFGTFLGFLEAGRGILNNIFERFTHNSKINNSKTNQIITIIIGFILIWIVIFFNIKILTFTSISSPFIGIVGCIIPTYLVYKIPILNKYKDLSIYIVIFTGTLLLISPILALLNKV